ncbi:hypothetical protein BTZ20_4509 [Rhodococcus sp. MTM3W5.2]|nr:hypothetical protein BTZ20_4509 [Rhodococcus sp. MTM3W5.2]
MVAREAAVAQPHQPATGDETITLESNPDFPDGIYGGAACADH